MDRILNTIKCAICHEIMESPVILPCNDTVCKKHVTNQIKDDHFKCDRCGDEHRIPANGFQPLPFLEELIKLGIGRLDFGSVHNNAKKSCESLEELLKEIEAILKDPYVLAHERISELKNSVQLKGEELKLIIDQEMKKLIDRLDEYETQSREYLSSNEFKEESKKLEIELKSAHWNLDSWLANLKELKVDHDKWEKIIKESSQEIKHINNEFDSLKNKLFLNKFEKNEKHVNWFKGLKIDSLLEYTSINKVSRIINESLFQNFEELLQMKELNGRNWALLYRASRDGFRAYDFHSRCDGFESTLTIVKSKNGNIFGGYTTIQWKSIDYDEDNGYEYDNSAFIFSLVNKENRPLIFEHTTKTVEMYTRGSVLSSLKRGPIFGGGHDLYICDRSNIIKNSYSNLGLTFTHPDYPHGSKKSSTILAGIQFFLVNEIEVFQIEE